jgi:ABC-type branched-subunit amino acid transport system permease subunit
MYLYGWDILHVLFMGYGGYALMNLLDRDKSQAKYTTFFVLGVLSCEHINTMINDFDGYDLGITTYSMLLACKMSALAWCYKDGGVHLKHSKLSPEE